MNGGKNRGLMNGPQLGIKLLFQLPKLISDLNVTGGGGVIIIKTSSKRKIKI
jgi:hypothetical protein